MVEEIKLKMGSGIFITINKIIAISINKHFVITKNSLNKQQHEPLTFKFICTQFKNSKFMAEKVLLKDSISHDARTPLL